VPMGVTPAGLTFDTVTTIGAPVTAALIPQPPPMTRP